VQLRLAALGHVGTVSCRSTIRNAGSSATLGGAPGGIATRRRSLAVIEETDRFVIVEINEAEIPTI
jgi:hypothetical protein